MWNVLNNAPDLTVPLKIHLFINGATISFTKSMRHVEVATAYGDTDIITAPKQSR
jgi:hypothetical protein